MSHILDTNFVIGLLRGFGTYWDYLNALLVGELPSISAITRAEVFAGCHPEEIRETNALLDHFTNLPVGTSIATLAGQYVYRFSRQGITLHLEDALIGATVVVGELSLVTQNVAHFPMLSLGRNLTQFPTR